MAVLLFFAFISGLITIFAPCIWPLLPIILSSTANGGKSKPLGITLGIMLSFGLLTLTISYIVKIIPFDPNALRLVAVVVIGFLGLTLVIPKLNQVVEGAVSRLSGKLGVNKQSDNNGFMSGFVTGLSLGVVWTPCAGPILATIATLAATQAVNTQVVLVTLAYIIGVGIPLFIFATAGARFFAKSRFINKYTGRIQQVFGVIMILTAVAIYTGYDRVLQAKLLDAFPSYSTFIYNLETNPAIRQQLDTLKGNKKINDTFMNFPMAKPGKLPDLGKAPEFTGINNWLNSEPLTMEGLKGKVVLVDFWTYTCINCVRTFPYITSWYEKYKDKGFVVVGVHTPEFEFEKNTRNVENAIKKHGITYPVAQDNNFETWNAYDNQYWPAHYLIDANGRARHIHFGEGAYEETERAIQELLKEAGEQPPEDMVSVNADSRSATEDITPEIYLGSERMQYYYPTRSLENGRRELTLQESATVHSFSLGGTWTINDQFSSSGSSATLALHFRGQKVFLVIHPPQGSSARARVYLDGKSIAILNAGSDVVDSAVTIDVPNIYNLIDLKNNPGQHILKLEFETPGTEVYAFTFG